MREGIFLGPDPSFPSRSRGPGGGGGGTPGGGEV